MLVDAVTCLCICQLTDDTLLYMSPSHEDDHDFVKKTGFLRMKSTFQTRLQFSVVIFQEKKNFSKKVLRQRS